VFANHVIGESLLTASCGRLPCDGRFYAFKVSNFFTAIFQLKQELGIGDKDPDYENPFRVKENPEVCFVFEATQYFVYHSPRVVDWMEKWYQAGNCNWVLTGV